MQEALRAYSLTHDQAIEHLRSVLSRTADLQDCVRIRCVSAETNGEWHNAICVVDLVKKNSPATIKRSLRYPHIHLLEEWLDVSTFSSKILGQLSNGIIPVDGEIITINVHARFTEWEFLPSNNNLSMFPGYLYKTPYVQKPQLAHHAPLLVYDLPFYPNPYFAIRHWIDFKMFHMDQDANIGTIQIFLPQCRAYLRELVISKGTLKISVVAEHDCNLWLKGAWEHGNGCSPFEASVSSAEISIPLEDQIDGFEVYLIGTDGTIYDFHRETSLWALGQERVLGSTGKQDEDKTATRNALQSGEGETIEFKPFIREGDDKHNEVIKTVMAFANTKGGAIFFGVKDDCTVQGVEKNIAHQAQKSQISTDEELSRYIGWLRQKIAGALNRSLNLSITHAEVDGHIVVLLRVPEGDQKPYAHVTNNNIFIRRGANNVVPHPDHDLPQLLQGRRGSDLDQFSFP